MALMKLIASPEELRKLSMQYNDLTSGGEKIQSAPTSIQVEIVKAKED
jgi:hypothetical protein